MKKKRITEYERGFADGSQAALRNLKELLCVPIRINCPECGALHVDKGKFATKPHHTHSCQTCGHTWRPAVENTFGVRFLPGFRDEQGGERGHG